MNERGLYLDLARMVDEAMNRAARRNVSWSMDAVYVCDRNHRMYTVCSTLEALEYVVRRHDVSVGPEESAWALTDQGVELYEELRRNYRRRA